MSHAYDDEETYTGNRGKYKSRIGGTIGQKRDEGSPGELLNDDSSMALKKYMENKERES